MQKGSGMYEWTGGDPKFPLERTKAIEHTYILNGPSLLDTRDTTVIFTIFTDAYHSHLNVHIDSCN